MINFILENLIQLLSVSILLSSEAVQKCQHCQLCVIWENSNDSLGFSQPIILLDST